MVAELVPNILFIHPDVYALGGAEQVCVRMMAAAQRLGKVTLVHCGGALDCEVISKWFHVALDPHRVRFVTANLAGSILARAQRWPIIKYALALRRARKIAADFDLVVGGYGECPIPAKRGIQYINVPIFCPAPEFLRYLNVGYDGALRSRVRPYYIHLSRLLCGWDSTEIAEKNTLVNSAWTADVVRQAYGISSLVAYPAVEVTLRPGDRDWVDWKQRESGFVMLGRIHPSKRLELGIEIIRRVRNRGYDVQLHIIGRGAEGYVERLQGSIVGMRHVHLHLNLARPQLEELVCRQRFGLHACEFEHYGIAAAEMQALGCVVFVPDSAGQRETVTNDEQRYVDLDDAVLKICRMLDNPDCCACLSADAVRVSHSKEGHRFEDFVGGVFEKVLAS